MAEKKKDPGEKTFLKAMGLCSFGMGAATVSVDTKDGKIIRIRPLHLDSKYDPERFRPWKLEARGKVFEPKLKSVPSPLQLVYKKRVYSPNRIRYPLKRVDWDPNGERHPETRGTSKFVRISWDEAAQLVADEIKRMQAQYGLTSILCQGDGHGETKVIQGAHGCNTALLNLMGGYTLQTRNPDSWEGWYWGAKHTWGMEPVGQMLPQANLVTDVAENTEMMLYWGCDFETTCRWFGNAPSQLGNWFKELGIKAVYICPDLNYSAAVHADKWIPILPNTDAALHLAIAYIWITEGTYDKEYIASHAYGFEDFEKYVLGQEDGIPKTPKWAAEITGVPSRTIKALAREWASKVTSIAHGEGGSLIRGPYSTEPGRLEPMLLAMQGLGKPGRCQFKMTDWALFAFTPPFPPPQVIPNLEKAYHGWILGQVPQQHIPKTLVPDAILNPPLSWYSTALLTDAADQQFVQYKYPADGCSEIHMIWTDSPCWEACWNDGNKMVQALRSPKIETIVAQHAWMENECLYSDIILPVNTKFEEKDINADYMQSFYSMLLIEGQAVDPVGESKSDYEAVGEVAKKLGLYERYTGGKSIEEWMKTGYETSGVAGMVSWEELNEKQYFVVPTDPNWRQTPPGIRPFLESPNENPLYTPSGKIEFKSYNLAKYFPDDEERPPVPHWIPEGESHHETRGCERAKDYPLLMVSNHPRWRMHAQLDDVPWFREIETSRIKGPDGYLYEPIWINPKDAAERNIKTGDVVQIFNERGIVLGGAYVTERIMPGAVYQDHGARADPIVEGEIDRGGSNNLICPTNITSKHAAGMATSGFLVQVEKADLQGLREKYPEAFARQYDPKVGQLFDEWIKKGQTQ